MCVLCSERLKAALGLHVRSLRLLPALVHARCGSRCPLILNVIACAVAFILQAAFTSTAGRRVG